jgi:hypothetical protein
MQLQRRVRCESDFLDHGRPDGGPLVYSGASALLDRLEAVIPPASFRTSARGNYPDVNSPHMITAGAEEGRCAEEVSIERKHVARGPKRKKRPRPLQSRRASVVEIGIGGEQVEDEALLRRPFHSHHADWLPAGQRQERGRDGGYCRKHAGGHKDVGRWEPLRQQKPA